MFITRSTPIRRFAVPLSAAAFFVAAAPALAMQPVDPGGTPVNPPKPPTAQLTASPIDAIVSTQPSIAQAQQKLVIVSGGAENVLYGSGDTVTFDASHSTKGDAPIDRIDWDLDGDGTYELSGSPEKADTESTHFFTTGDHTVRVKVSDSDGSYDTASIVIHVRNAPHAVIASNLATPLVGQDVQYSAAGSTAEPSIADVAWDLDGNGTFETDSGTSLQEHSSYATPGKRTVAVKITDTDGASRTATVEENVNQAPTAAFTNTTAVVGQKVTFDGSGSGDDQPIADYAWDLDGNGSFETDSGTSPTTSKTYTTAGTVNVRLRVTDSLGATSVVTHQVVVAPAPKGAGGSTGGSTGAAGGSTGTTLSGKLAPVLTFASKKLRLAKTGKVALKVTCPATAAGCHGTIKLRTTAKHPKSLGSASFALKAGQTKTVRILLPAVQRRAIRRAGHLEANAIVSVADTAGIKGTSTQGILIAL